MGLLCLTAEQVIFGDINAINKNAATELDLMAEKEILITGGADFLGYMLVNLLAQVGISDGRAPINLTVYENFSLGHIG